MRRGLGERAATCPPKARGAAHPNSQHAMAHGASEAARVIDFDHYGRVVGLRVTGGADSVLAPSLLEAAERDPVQ